MAIATLDALITALGAGAQRGTFYKVFTPQAAGAYTSMWNITGIPGAAATPSSGVGGDIPTDATAGAFPFTNPGSGLTYLSRMIASTSQACALILYDRLWHNSGLSPTSLTAQTVNSTALTRPDALGSDVEAWMQVYAVMGAGSTAPTISYTDQDGNASNTGTLQGFATTAAVGRSFPFALAAGDTGVRSIQTYTNGATMTSGTFGLVLRRRIATIVIPTSNSGASLDALTGGLPDIPNDACLELLHVPSSTSAATLFGSLSLIQG